MKSILSAIALATVMTSTVAMARPNQNCLNGILSAQQLHQDVVNAYAKLANSFQTNNGNVREAQIQVLTKTQMAQSAVQLFLDACK